jgi:hypothetical protein
MTTPDTTAPTLNVTTDKDSYVVGDTLTLNVTYADAQTTMATLTVTVTGTDPAGNTAQATTQVAVTNQVSGPVDVSATDSFGDTYAVVSNDNTGSAVLSTTVGTPPAA